MAVHYAGSGRGCKFGTGTVSVWVNHGYINALWPSHVDGQTLLRYSLTARHQRARRVGRRAQALC
jgi:hypothetical protein